MRQNIRRFLPVGTRVRGPPSLIVLVMINFLIFLNFLMVLLAQANCTSFFNRSTNILSLKKIVFFAVLNVLFSKPPQKTIFHQVCPFFSPFQGGQILIISWNSEGLRVIFCEKNILVAVRKSHCHVFLGGLDPGQAPLQILLLMLRLTLVFLSLF